MTESTSTSNGTQLGVPWYGAKKREQLEVTRGSATSPILNADLGHFTVDRLTPIINPLGSRVEVAVKVS